MSRVQQSEAEETGRDGRLLEDISAVPPDLVAVASSQVHSRPLADAFIESDLQRLIHTLTHRRRRQPRRATASWSGAVRVSCLAQGHLETRLGGAGDRTSDLLVTSRHALPPEQSRPQVLLTVFYPAMTTPGQWEVSPGSTALRAVV